MSLPGAGLGDLSLSGVSSDVTGLLYNVSRAMFIGFTQITQSFIIFLLHGHPVTTRDKP